MAKTLYVLVSSAYYQGYEVHAYSESPLTYIGGLLSIGNMKGDLYSIQVQDDWYAVRTGKGEISSEGWHFYPPPAESGWKDKPKPIMEVLKSS